MVKKQLFLLVKLRQVARTPAMETCATETVLKSRSRKKVN